MRTQSVTSKGSSQSITKGMLDQRANFQTPLSTQEFREEVQCPQSSQKFSCVRYSPAHTQISVHLDRLKCCSCTILFFMSKKKLESLKVTLDYGALRCKHGIASILILSLSAFKREWNFKSKVQNQYQAPCYSHGCFKMYLSCSWLTFASAFGVCACACVCMRVTRQRIHFETLGKGTKNASSIDTVICTVAD